MVMVDLSTRLERWADHRADAVAIGFEGRTWTYRELASATVGTASALSTQLDVLPGDRVAYCGLNRPELLIALFACARLGAIFVPLNWRLTPHELSITLADADARVLIGDEDLVAAIDARRAQLPALRDVVNVDAMFNGVDMAVTAGPGPRGRLEDPVLIVYTSGTTGRPKGAVLTQAALAANAINATHFQDLTSADHALTVIPMFHVGGLNIQTVPLLLGGGRVTIHRRFDAAAWLADVEAVRPTLSVLVPATLQAVQRDRAWATVDLSSLRLIVTGSSAVPVPLIEAFHARGVPVAQMYGSTETAPIAVHQRADTAMRFLGSTGVAATLCELRIVDGDDDDVTVGSPGEVLVRGDNLFSGYWRAPAATAASELIDGDGCRWFRTGDIGYIDGDGQLVISDRKKDMIISGGENIYPAEIELALADCPGVVEAAVVGQPDDRWGEVPVAVIVTEASAHVDVAAVQAWLVDRLAPFKRPRTIVFVDSLPRNAMGKVLKHEVKVRLAAINERDSTSTTRHGR
jgi:fatty-acyl-CoA synthase